MKGAVVFLMFLVTLVVGLDPRQQRDSECQSANNRNCTTSQVCVERRLNNTLHKCVQRIGNGGTCMRPEAYEMPDENEPVRLIIDGISDRDRASVIDGRMTISCASSLQCRNMTCQARPDTNCTRRRVTNQQLRCGENGMFELLQCRRLRNETDSRMRPSAAICSCTDRMTGEMRDWTIVRTRADVPSCGRSCSYSQNRRNISIMNGESFTRTGDQNRCAACACNDGQLQCRMLRNATCSAGQGQTNCRSNGKDVKNGEMKTDGLCNKCRCIDGVLRCTQLPGCKPNSTSQERDMENENDRKQCEACMDMPASPVCVSREGRTFPTRCHAMMCAKVPRDQIVDGPCRDDNECIRSQCSSGNTCFRTSTRAQMSSKLNRPDARRMCVDRDSLTCATTTSSDTTQRITTANDNMRDVMDRLRASMDDSNDRDQDRVVCSSSGMTYPSTCHMILESERENPEVRHPGPCKNIDRSEMVCGADGVTYRNRDIMRTQGGNVRMDYSGACHNVTGSGNMNTVGNRCKMVRKDERCPKLTNCTRRVNTSDGCCPVCGSVVMLAMDQNRVENQANTLPDVDSFQGALLRNRTNRRLPVIPRNATRSCNVSITRPTNVPGNVTEVLFRARNMSDAKECHKHAMQMAEMLNKAGSSSTVKPVSTAESMVAAAAVAPELEEEATAGSIPFVASPILMLGLVLCKVFFV